MNCTQTIEQFVDYLTGNIDSGQREAMQAHVTGCASCRRQLEEVSEAWTRLGVLTEEQPSANLRQGFYTMLAAEVAAGKQGRKRWREFWQRLGQAWLRQPRLNLAAAALVLLLGFAAGLVFRPAGGRDIFQLNREMAGMRQLLTVSLLDNPSPGIRLQGIRVAAAMSQPDEQTVQTLLDILDNDPNVNVRLATSDALYLFGDRPLVRARVIGSLARQTSPLVQIALIDLLAAWREKRALQALLALQQDEKLNPQVKSRLTESLPKLL